MALLARERVWRLEPLFGNGRRRPGGLASTSTTPVGSPSLPPPVRPWRAPASRPPARSAGSGRDRDPPFTAGFFLTGGEEPGDHQEGVRQKAKRYVPVPSAPPPHLVVVQAHLSLGLGEAILHPPAPLADLHQLTGGRPFGAVGLVEGEIVRLFGAAA